MGTLSSWPGSVGTNLRLGFFINLPVKHLSGIIPDEFQYDSLGDDQEGYS